MLNVALTFRLLKKYPEKLNKLKMELLLRLCADNLTGHDVYSIVIALESSLDVMRLALVNTKRGVGKTTAAV
jgi:hypothetical protein